MQNNEDLRDRDGFPIIEINVEKNMIYTQEGTQDWNKSGRYSEFCFYGDPHFADDWPIMKTIGIPVQKRKYSLLWKIRKMWWRFTSNIIVNL